MPHLGKSSDNDAFTRYPIGWIHQHCRRLPAFGVGSSATALPPLSEPWCCYARPGWVSVGTTARRHRRVVDPRRPCQIQEARVPSERGGCRFPSRFTLLCACLAKHLRDLKRSFRRPQPLASLARGVGLLGRFTVCKRVATPAAFRCAGTRRRRTGRCRTTDPVNRSSPSPIASLTWRPRRRVVSTNRSSATADRTQPITHVEPDLAVSPPPSRHARRSKRGRVRWNPHLPGVDVSRLPWNRRASAPRTSAPRQAGSRRCCAPP